MRYHIIFKGDFVKGKTLPEIRRNLMKLLKNDHDRVETLLNSSRMIIKKAMLHEHTEKYVALLKKAGLLCEIQPVDSPEEKKSANRPLVSYQADGSDVRFSPILCNRITSTPGGIRLNLPENPITLFKDIQLISITRQDIKSPVVLLFFIEGCKRPFICDADKIVFSEFSMVKGLTGVDSLRNFLKLLATENSGLVIEQTTYDFINGGQLQDFNDDILTLSTALSRTLSEKSFKYISDGLISTNNTILEQPNKIGSDIKEKQVLADRKNESSSVDGADLKYCPKCHAYRVDSQTECGRCGLIFAKWKSRKQDEIHGKQDVIDSINTVKINIFERNKEEIESWIQKSTFVFSLMMIAGFLLPLFKRSLLYNMSVLIWPWQIMGINQNQMTQAAFAPYLGGGQIAFWALTPLIAGGLILGMRMVSKCMKQSVAMVLIGSITLILTEIIWLTENQILGMVILPSSFSGGLILFFGIVSVSLIASANYFRKFIEFDQNLRIITGFSAVLLCAILGFTFFSSNDIFKSWIMLTLQFMFLFYALLSVLSASVKGKNDNIYKLLSGLLWITLLFIPIACVIAQRLDDNPVNQFIMGAGDTHNIVVSVVKWMFITYGSAFTIAAGLTGIMYTIIYNRK